LFNSVNLRHNLDGLFGLGLIFNVACESTEIWGKVAALPNLIGLIFHRGDFLVREDVTKVMLTTRIDECHA
jgi:hypothetical protein